MQSYHVPGRRDVSALKSCCVSVCQWRWLLVIWGQVIRRDWLPSAPLNVLRPSNVPLSSMWHCSKSVMSNTQHIHTH